MAQLSNRSLCHAFVGLASFSIFSTTIRVITFDRPAIGQEIAELEEQMTSAG